MATRTFLASADLEHAQTLLRAPVSSSAADLWKGPPFPAQDFSSWLSLNIEDRLRSLPHWTAAHPIAIGSWGRGELCPHSDLDIVFTGDEESVRLLLDEVAALGIDLKYRFPKDKEDWSEDSNVFEVNALFWAKAFTNEAAAALQHQKNRIYDQRKTFRRNLLKSFNQERDKRNQRYDSIANYLEPQIKFGAGGLRDIQQALMVAFWFPEKFEAHAEIFSVLSQLKGFLLTVRQKLHLLGYQDILAAPAQVEVARWFGFKTHSEFMRQVQNALAQVSFYCDLVFEIAAKKVTREEPNQIYKSPEDVFRVLSQSPSLGNQALLIHRSVKDDLHYHPHFKKYFHIEMSEEVLRAFFRSGLIAAVFPEFLKITGVVQHDQYHRYTVDAHIFQAVRQVLRIYKKRKYLGKLAALTKNFKPLDWEILLWTALYHDLGKARQKDHSIEGKMLVEQDLGRIGAAKTLTTEVAWMVEYHLLLSNAAFRKDPNSPQVWRELIDKGVHGDRLRRLAIFTAVDIYATNPEAWSSWKEKLIFQLVHSMETPQGHTFLSLQKLFQKKRVQVSTLEVLDPALLSTIPPKELVKDLLYLESHKDQPSVACYRSAEEGTWVRFYHPHDQKGLFLQFLTRLWQAGVVIHHAFVHTHDRLGVYDWFEVKTDKNLGTLKKILESEVPPPEFKQRVYLSEISLVLETDKEWVFSFRGTDKKGILMAAAQALFDFGLEIRWAKIHTWGRQVDDIFSVVPTVDRAASAWTSELQKRLVEKS